jgi:hypothetical protein
MMMIAKLTLTLTLTLTLFDDRITKMLVPGWSKAKAANNPKDRNTILHTEVAPHIVLFTLTYHY